MPCGLDLLLLLQQKIVKEMLAELILTVKIELPDLVMINRAFTLPYEGAK